MSIRFHRFRTAVPTTLLILVAATLFTSVAVVSQAPAPAQDPCAGSRDLRLTNGKIVTMDARGSTVSEVTIQDGRFTAVGARGGQRLSPCTREINLRGRTAVPGLIDNHNHIVLLGIRPGYHTPLESAASIADIQATHQGPREDRAGGRVHHLDGRVESGAVRREAAAQRWPSSTPPHPSTRCCCSRASPVPPRRTREAGRSSPARESWSATPAPSAPTRRRWLRSTRCEPCRRSKTGSAARADAMAYSVSVGVTTNADMGAFNLPGTPDLQGSFEADTLASADQFRMYDAFVALHREGRMTTRLRVFFLTMDTRPEVPMLSRAAAERVPRNSATTCCESRASASLPRAGRSSASRLRRTMWPL